MIDTHCHLLYPGIGERLEAVLQESRNAGVSGFITIGTTTTDSMQSTVLAEARNDVWCTAGVHPLHSHEPQHWQDMHRAGQHPKCVAWGELGLDKHWPTPDFATQRRVLDEQLSHIVRWRAEGMEKPIVIHCRKAVPELLPILRASGLPPHQFVFHCFTEGPEDARAVLDFGAMISFTGVVTFANAPEVHESARLVPNDRIMCETDAPFLSPEPVRKQRPCIPAYVVHTARALAALRGMPYAEFDALTDANAARFFGLKR